jgi:hypothetical protein
MAMTYFPQTKIIYRVVYIIGLLSPCGCKDECREYSDYSCKQLQEATYNVYFYFPKSNEDYYLGTVEGLDQCGAVAYSYADSKKLGQNSEWSYICCLKTKDSECAEKHR